MTIYKSTKLYYFCCKVCKLTEVRRQRERKKICDNCKIKLNQDRITKSKKQRKLIVIDKLKEISYKKNQPITDIEIQRRNRLSNIAKSRNLGGYKEGSGRGKKGRYNGFWCDSSYELAFIYYMVSQGKTIQRNTIKYNYIFDDKEYKWMPDFIIDGKLVEIKGYLDLRNKAKIDQFPNPDNLHVIYGNSDEMKSILSFVKTRYGTNFTEVLYDK